METTISGRIQLHGFGIATLAILAILFMSIGGCQSVHRPEADLVITNVHIVDVVDGKITSDNDVFITGDTISDITRAGSLPHPANAIILDGNGKFLIPGLWDAHVHVISNSAWQMPLMLAHGITSVRNMHTTEPDPLIAIKRVKADIDAGAYPSPRLLASGPIIDGPNNSAWPSSVIVDSPASAKAAVKQQQADGADFIKVYSALDAPSMMALLEQAEKSGIAVDGHMPASIDPAVAVSAGMRTVEHTSGLFAGCSDNELIVRNKFHEYFTGDPSPFPQSQLTFFSLLIEQANGYNKEKCRALLHVYAKTGVASTPTLVNVWAGIHSDNVIQDTASMRYMPESVREFWTSAATAPFNAAFVEHLQPVYAHSRLLTLALKNAGIPVLTGTDVGNPFLIPGVALHQELMLLNEAGLSPLDSLRAATLNPASVFGFEDSLGQVKTGFIADLVLLDSNPIVNMSAVSDINAVVRGGKLYNRSTLNQILSDLQKR